MTFNEADRDQLGGDIAGIRTENPNKPTRREDYEYRSPYVFGRGDIIKKDDPHGKYHYGLIDLGDSQHAMKSYLSSIGQGYEFAMAKDFDLRPELRRVWKKNLEGILSMGGKDRNTMAIVWMTEAQFDRMRSKETRQSDVIQRSVEQQMAEKQSESQRGSGDLYEYAGSTFEIVDDGEQTLTEK